MREYIQTNLRIIKKYIKKRKKVISQIDRQSITKEFKEWNESPIIGEGTIWTLPDLTRSERFENFCRSIKKKIF